MLFILVYIGFFRSVVRTIKQKKTKCIAKQHFLSAKNEVSEDCYFLPAKIITASLQNYIYIPKVYRSHLSYILLSKPKGISL